MSDFFDNLVPLAFIGLLAFFFSGIGWLIYVDAEGKNLRYEQCIAADKQWVNGSCVR